MSKQFPIAILCAVLLQFGTAFAQGTGTLTLIVPSAAGSAPDIIARLVGDDLRTRLGQPVVIDNRPGGGGIVAVTAAKSAAPNGNTLLMAQAAVVVVTPLTYKAAKYDMESDFETVSVIAESPMMFAANPASGPKTLADALAQAKAKPGALTLSSPSRGSIPHLTGERLAQLGGVQFNGVPMSQSGQALQAVVGGDAQISVDGAAPYLPQIKAGRLRALAVTANRILPGLEGVPLAKDTVPGLTVSGWFMLFAPKGTPDARIQALNAAVDATLKSPELVQKLQSTANYPVGGSVADARSFLAREKKQWADTIQRAGMQPE